MEDGIEILGYGADVLNARVFVFVVPLGDWELVDVLQNAGRAHGGEVLFEVAVRGVGPDSSSRYVSAGGHLQGAEGGVGGSYSDVTADDEAVCGCGVDSGVGADGFCAIDIESVEGACSSQPDESGCRQN